MTKKPTPSKDAADKVVKNIRRKTRETYSAEENIRIVLAGLHGEESIAALCRGEGIAESLYEPHRVYRRVSGSMITLLFRQRSILHGRPPLLRSG